MNTQLQLKIISFFQYFIWGSWLITFSSYMIHTLGFSGMQVGMIYGVPGIAAIFMPGVMGIIADKWIPANYLYALSHFICAIVLFYASFITDYSILYWVMMLNAFFYIPTLALSNSISYFYLDREKLDIMTIFPKIRVFGTIGFIVAMWIVSLSGLELSRYQLYIAAAVSMLLALYSLQLPTVPVNSGTNDNKSLLSRFGLDALVLFKQPILFLFFFFSMLLGAALQVTNTFGGPFLHDFATVPEYSNSLVVLYPSILLSVSQISESLFILAIPFFLKKYGIKNVMMMSMVAWALRFGLFAYGDPTPAGIVLLLLSMIVYGCAFDFFNISGSIFIDQQVDPKIRASAQGLFLIVVNGLGVYFGNISSSMVVEYFTVSGVRDWHSIWLIFAGYALTLAVLFYLVFPYKRSAEEAKQLN